MRKDGTKRKKGKKKTAGTRISPFAYLIVVLVALAIVAAVLLITADSGKNPQGESSSEPVKNTEKTEETESRTDTYTESGTENCSDNCTETCTENCTDNCTENCTENCSDSCAESGTEAVPGLITWTYQGPLPCKYDWVYPAADPIPVQGGKTMPSWIIQDLIPVSEINRPGTKLSAVRNVVVHWVGNTGSSAKDNREYFASLQDPNEPNPRQASAHFVIGLEGEILQVIPIDELAYAQGSTKTEYNRNTDCISIENCHPGDDGAFNEKTYAALVHLASWLLEQYGLTSEDLIRHYDVTGKKCPLYYTDDTASGGHPEAWLQFKADVKAYMTAHPDIAHEFP